MEKFFKTKAVVLSTNDFGDANRVVTFFTKDYGKIEANAYGCRRAKSSIAGAMQMFNYVALEFTKGIEVNRVHEADIINYHSLNEDLNKLAYASVFFEIVKRMTPLEQADSETFNLLVNSLKAFDKRNPRIVNLISISQFIAITGFAIEYPQSLQNLSDTLQKFDWQDTTKFILKSGEVSTIEKFLLNYVQSIINAPLNSLNFLQMIISLQQR